jgi:hypothetical protein
MKQETEDSLSRVMADFRMHDGPARVMLDPVSQKAFLKTYNPCDLRAADPQYEPFQILAHKGMECLAT